MKHSNLILALGMSLACAGAAPASSADFSYLDPIDVQPRPWVPETSDETDEDREGPSALAVDLQPFFKEFARDGKVTIAVGYGHESYYPERATQILEMLKLLAARHQLRLSGWSIAQDSSRISFRDDTRGLSYEIDLIGERNQYLSSFADHEVVMYHGHSRYGRGPAFGSFQNYFRMGRTHETIEADTRNRYYTGEPIQLTQAHPLQTVYLGGERYSYQYRGNWDKQSKLPPGSYTINLPGYDRDLKRARFLPGRQIFYFYSCKNRKYWREALRDRFPDSRQKLVFGTFKDAFGSTKPEAVMILSVIRQLSTSTDIVAELNATQDCEECFTSY